MNRLLFIIFSVIILVKPGFSQSYSYAWINDVQIGLPGSAYDLRGIVEDINNRRDIKFAVLTGNLTYEGTDAQLEQAKKILDSLSVPWHVIPGRRDLEYSQSAGVMFNRLFGSENFSFEYNGTEHIGFNAGLFRNPYGHASVENLNWLDSILTIVPKNREIIMYLSFPVGSGIDNWYEITNKLAGYGIKEFIVSNPEIKANRLTGSNGINSAESKTSRGNKSRMYTLVSENADSIFFYAVANDKKEDLWGTLKKDTSVYTEIDSVRFKDYSGNAGSKKASLIWRKELKQTPASPVITDNNRIYATAAGGNIYCLDSTGNNLWKYSSGESFAGSPVLTDGNLIAGSLSGDLISLDAKTGNVVQSIGLSIPITSQLIIVKGEYNGEKTSGVILGTSKGDLYFYDASTFEMIWENHYAKGAIYTKPLLAGNRIIYGGGDGFLYCIDARSGIINWKWQDNPGQTGPFLCDPVSDGRNVYIVAPDKSLYAVDLMLGRTVWKKDYDALQAVGITGDKKSLLIKSRDNYFYIVSASGGRLERKVETGTGEDLLPNTPAASEKGILFCSWNGDIYLIDKNYKPVKLFFMGNSPLQNIVNFRDNKFIASNKDGRIIAFKLE